MSERKNGYKTAIDILNLIPKSEEPTNEGWYIEATYAGWGCKRLINLEIKWFDGNFLCADDDDDDATYYAAGVTDCRKLLYAHKKEFGLDWNDYTELVTF